MSTLFGSPRRPALRIALTAGLSAGIIAAGVAGAFPAAAAPAGCTPVQVVGARGTLEPGSLGTLVGPVAQSVAQKLPGKVSTFGIPYEAGTFDYPLSTAGGVKDTVDYLTKQGAACPSQRFVLIGYSQGAQVIGDALATTGRALGTGDMTIPASVSRRIAAVVMFGDPRFVGSEPFNAGSFDKSMSGLYARQKGGLAAYADRIRDYCNGGDSVCQAGSVAAIAHLSYFGTTSSDAVRWIVSKLQSGPSPAVAGRTTAAAPGTTPSAGTDSLESQIDGWLGNFWDLFATKS